MLCLINGVVFLVAVSASIQPSVPPVETVVRLDNHILTIIIQIYRRQQVFYLNHELFISFLRIFPTYIKYKSLKTGSFNWKAQGLLLKASFQNQGRSRKQSIRRKAASSRQSIIFSGDDCDFVDFGAVRNLGSSCSDGSKMVLKQS